MKKKSLEWAKLSQDSAISLSFYKNINFTKYQLYQNILYLARLVQYLNVIKTGFQFMANKQFRVEKNWEHQCALIFRNRLWKTNTFNLYMKNHSTNFFGWTFGFFFCKFLDQIWLRKTVFWTNTEKNDFFLQSNIYMFTIYNNFCW